MNSKAITNKANIWKKFYKKNIYYHKTLHNLILNLIPPSESVVEFGSHGGEFLNKLPNINKVGVESDASYLKLAGKQLGKAIVVDENTFRKKYGKRKFDVVTINNISEMENIQDFIYKLKRNTKPGTRIIVLYFNYLWKPILDLTQSFGLRMPYFKEPNWLSEEDVNRFFILEDFEKVISSKKVLIPVYFPIVSAIANKYLSVIPLINNLSLMNYSIFRTKRPKKQYSVSIIVPARNEENNMKGILKKIPSFGKNQEVIFIEGHSVDKTFGAIKSEMSRYKGNMKTSLYKQKGIGKADAVRLGFSKAKNEVLMILDADLTVDPAELPKFYNALVESKGELIIGSRLVYPMEKQAMRTLNVLGNKLFSIAFSFLLDQKIKDTLCGTKVLLKKDYIKIKKTKNYFGDFDPFGDFDLLFGASRLNLKIQEIPIRYKERTYGNTNIKRFEHGLLLLKMVVFAMKKIKFT